MRLPHTPNRMCSCGIDIGTLIHDNGRPMVPVRNGVALLRLPVGSQDVLQIPCARAAECFGRTILAVDQVYGKAVIIRASDPAALAT